MKTKFLSICVGISALLFSAGFLIRSVAPAQAAPVPEEFLQENTSKIGKYMMMVTPETEKYYETIIVWDTESGASVSYIHKPDGYSRSSNQLPEKPL